MEIWASTIGDVTTKTWQTGQQKHGDFEQTKGGRCNSNRCFQDIFWMLVLYGHFDTNFDWEQWKTTLVLPCFTPNHIGGIWWNKVDWQIQVSCWKLVGINQWSAKYQSSINIRSRKFHLHHLHTIRLLQTEPCWWWRCSFVLDPHCGMFCTEHFFF